MDLRPQHQVPVCRHDAVATDAHLYLLGGLVHEIEKPREVVVFVEDPRAFIRAIDHVVDEPAWQETTRPWHWNFTSEDSPLSKSGPEIRILRVPGFAPSAGYGGEGRSQARRSSPARRHQRSVEIVPDPIYRLDLSIIDRLILKSEAI
jgi:hypothetical protein